MQTLLSIFGCLLLSLLTDKLQSCLSSVCWPEATSSPSCQSGRLCSSDRLLAAIRWIAFIPELYSQDFTDVFKQPCWNPVKFQMWVNFSLDESMSVGHLPHMQGVICEKKQTVGHKLPYALFNSTI